MTTEPLETPRLILRPQRRDDVLAALEQLPPEDRAQVSDAWKARLAASAPCDPWIHGYRLEERESGEAVGQAGYKGPPDDGVVEIAYVVAPERRGRGYATEAADALVRAVRADPAVRTVRAHTLPQDNASTRVLTRCGFRKVGTVIDPEDGDVWRWEIP